jgi:chromosomal replication initiation ATPase DnaA
VTLADIAARSRRSRRATRARHVAMYLAHVAFGVDLAAIAIVFGRSRRSAARACGLVEDARDDPAFDAALAGLEVSARILRDYERAEKAA